MPALIAPSPITAMTLRRSPRKSRATAMPSAEEIEVELCAAPNGSYSLSERLVKPDRPPPWRMRADAVAPAGQDLVRIGLVADVPDQPVMRRVEDVVERHGQLDHAEAGAEMAAGDRHGVDQLRAQLVGELPQIFLAAACADRPGYRPGRAAASDWKSGGLVLRPILRSSRTAGRSTNRAASRKSSALCSNKSRCATAWRTKSSACARARSTPRIETNVAFPAAASAPTGLPVSAAEPSTSSRSSAIWKARPRSWA